LNPGKLTRSVLGRVLLILAVSGAIITVAVYQGKAIIGRSYPTYHVRSGPAVIEPADGSVFLRSYPVIFNGTETQFAHYSSQRKAEEVIRDYKNRTQVDKGPRESSGAPMSPGRHAPMLASFGKGCSTLSYVTAEGTAVGIIAYDNPDSGGSEYFVGAMPAKAFHQATEGDRPGREPPGVPKPLRSTRISCIENLGGVASVLAFYEAWGPPSEMVEHFRREMADNRWKERADSSKVLTRNYDGIALLSFSRGHEQCIVGVDQAPVSGKIIVSILWAERRWLPKGIAL